MKRLLLASALAVLGCGGSSSSGPPAPAVVGTAYDVQKLLVPGSVTIVDFGAPW